MKTCPKCGANIAEESKFCNVCGANLAGTTEVAQTTIINNNYNVNNKMFVTKRDIVTTVILSLVTCGIYGIYWFIVMTDDSNKVSGDNATSGALAFVYSLITCGIYFIYWNYKMGKKMYQAGQSHGKDISDNSVVYLLLSIFGFSIINYCLIQNDLNKFAE